MPTDDMNAISAKVRTDEKALFEQLCETEGLTRPKLSGPSSLPALNRIKSQR